jgi:hypothetical protein
MLPRVAMEVQHLPSPTVERRMVSAMKRVQMEDRFSIRMEILFPLVESAVAVSLSTQMSSKSTEQSTHPAKMVNKDIDIKTAQEMEDLAQAQDLVEASSCLQTK